MQRIGSIGNQFADGDFGMSIKRMNNEMQELFHLCFILKFLDFFGVVAISHDSKFSFRCSFVRLIQM